MAPRRKTIRPYGVPTCHELVRRGGEREWCDVRATHRVEYRWYGRWWIDHVCLGHLATALRDADDRTDSARRPEGRYGPVVESPAPRVYRLTFTLDRNAKAYGRVEVIPQEFPLTGPIQPALF